MDILARLLGLLRAPRKYFVGMFVVGFIVLLAPDSWLSQLGILTYRTKYKPYFWLIVVVLGIIAVAGIYESVESKLDNNRLTRARKKRLSFLTAEEKSILRGYIEGKTKTRYLSIGSGVVAGLVAEEIIYRSTSVNQPITHGLLGFGYNIQPWAWGYLNEHPELLS